MSPFALTTAVNTLANALADHLSDDDLTLASAMFTQLGDTLTTISVLRSRDSQ